MLDGALPRLHWIDLAMLGWLLLSMLIGVWRGLVFELLSVASLLVAWFGCQWTAPQIASWLPVGEPGSRLNHAAALVIGFVAILLVCALASRLLRMLVHATPLAWPDRALGAGFGALRGVIVLLVVAAVAGVTPLASAPAWKRSQGAAWLNAALDGVRPLLPIQLSQHLPAA
ncbi:MAG: CvpA family protein [Piscinibacter sp.]|nr:CvpA family protein [Piscinibacter sp.]